MNPPARIVTVWVDNSLAGTLTITTHPINGLEDQSFSYSTEWLANTMGFAISPDLPLTRGVQRPRNGRTTFGAFEDATPDAWGNKLLARQAQLDALRDGLPTPRMTPATRLLLVPDHTRQGALRFSDDDGFLSPRTSGAGLTDLEKLARAAQRFVDSGEIDSEHDLLLGAGSSPGGAQPKAWVSGPDGNMVLAKFPKTSDVGDLHLWEHITMVLQRRAGIRVQPSRVLPLDSERSIFLTDRFDRVGDKRIPFQSVRTLLQLVDHQHVDYTTMAREIAHVSAHPTADAAEMFSRAIFAALVNNIDDHMRNHGILRIGRGWRLSPAFDVNPARSGTSDTPLTPGGDPGDRDVRALIEHSADFRLTRSRAVERAREIAAAVASWREVAVSEGANLDSLNNWARTFDDPNLERIRALSDGDRTVIDLS
ncbi:type II toxin-antitoxin system HipA family toxin [Mycetocola tolaasinivorans]|uniref:Type II toxin-antitoxin system HipA family toxin n=1 Tax=Mycetocola tolaasinivorans TaxID=76635 RepID=A0A3L7A5N5_9MICO|nr:type II toxin-antitoxin system HipA family toxin [Mycetocola tolaasinivorans]RLP75636.1 type II toxin-antitoxin system HipA family toxin [Mycetocola tolaasinivorans]